MRELYHSFNGFAIKCEPQYAADKSLRFRKIGPKIVLRRPVIVFFSSSV